MYDAPTSALIRSATPLPGLALDRLPEELTAAYADVISARLSIAQGAPAPEWAARLGTIRRLANTFEALVILGTAKQHERACAFVAATARHLLHLSAASKVRTAWLDRDAIDPAISAMLLFTIAGYPSDAIEVANGISASKDNSAAAQAFIGSLQYLVRGALEDAIGMRGVPSSASDNPEDQAVDTLWLRLLEGVSALANALLGRASFDSARRTFVAVRDLCAFEVTLPTDWAATLSLYSGPHHLASLLHRAVDTFSEMAMVSIPTPPGISPTDWAAETRRFSSYRPYLWQNHRDAIQSGFLIPGTGSVLSFPTGAGKSTLSELKMAVTLLLQRHVLVIAPTIALVHQLRRSFGRTFPRTKVVGEYLDSDYAEVNESQAQISVMTPERCLAILGSQPDIFASVGLVLFDEAHILHPTRGRHDRRSIDSTLSLLRLLQEVPDADYVLVSAMVGNGSELAAWLSDVTQRSCLSLDLLWKPTRQVRGCVVYPKTEIEAAGAQRKAERGAKTGKRGAPSPPSATPLALFCLKQSWSTMELRDYKIESLGQPVELSRNKNGFLTANRNNVSAQLAIRLAEQGIKTIVFAQDKRYCESIAKKVSESTVGKPATFNSAEKGLLDSAARDLGDPVHVLAPPNGKAAFHHSLMLASERLLAESIFSRADGVSVIAATPTLAQGINLPAAAVVLAGDERFDEALNKNVPLQAHEILNAAGRAGRAGMVAQGLVLVVPGDVVNMDVQANTISQKWHDLRGRVFSNPDQCLVVGDPIELMLDHIALAPSLEADDVYFIERLPGGPGSAERTQQLLGRSLAAFRAKRAGTGALFEQRIKTAATLRTSRVPAEAVDWLDRASGQMGLNASILGSLHDHMRVLGLPEAGVPHYVGMFFDWLAVRGRYSDVISWTTVHDAIDEDLDEPQMIERLRALTADWIAGATISAIEKAITGKTGGKAGACVSGRKFALRVSRELSYGVGLLAFLHRAYLSETASGTMPLGLATAAPCVREGVDSPRTLAVKYVLGESAARVDSHQVSTSIAHAVQADDPLGDFASVIGSVRRAIRVQRSVTPDS